tara:strand:+ start:149 stop:511 length:363 start_codon:yes stop_codon:yes gene_type:complete
MVPPFRVCRSLTRHKALRDAKEVLISAAQAHLGDADVRAMEEAHGDIVCPMTLCLLRDPVMASDGHSYERAALQELFERNRNGTTVSPMTRETLDPKILLPNHTLRKWLYANLSERTPVT